MCSGSSLASPLGLRVIGFIGSLPFLAQGVHFPAAWLTSRFGERRVAVVAVALSRQALWPLAALPMMPLSLTGKQGVLVAVGATGAVLGVIGNNAWTAWMGELVPARLRGRYFGRRSAICLLAGSLGTFAAGSLLDVSRAHGDAGPALALLAAMACVAGAVSTILMSRMHVPRTPQQSEIDFTTALRPFRDPSALRWLAFLVPWSMGVGVSSSFFTVYLLSHLGLEFRTVALLGIVTAVTRLLSAPLWGRAIDRVGARPVLIALSFLIVLIPLLWLLAEPHRLWPIVVDALATGVLWGGHNLASFHLPLRLAPRDGRAFFLAAFSTTSGLSFALAASLGGALASRIPDGLVVGGHHFVDLQVLFALSAIVRLGSAFLTLRLREPGSHSLGDLGRLVINEAPRRPSDVLDTLLLRPPARPPRRAG